MNYNAIFFYTGGSFWLIIAIFIVIGLLVAMSIGFYKACYYSRGYIYLKLLAKHGISEEEMTTMRTLFCGFDTTPEIKKIIVKNIVKIGKQL